MTEYARASGRVILLDAAGRVLLWRGVFVPGRSDTLWFTPGGGIDPGETAAEAAARELAEETGLVATPAALGEPVAYTTGYADLGFAAGEFHDTYFAYRVESHDVDLSGHDELERANLLEHRWWTLDELAATTERVVPIGLAGVVEMLLDGRRPEEPLRLPWHH